MKSRLVSPTGKEIVLKPVRANAGVEAWYRKRLYQMIDAMQKALVRGIEAQWKANNPLALDAAIRDGSPANAMRRAMRRMSKRWLKAFDDGAEGLARYFSEKAAGTTDLQLKAILKKAGFTVEFKATEAVNNAMQAAIGENVSLIRSIAQQHLTEVEGLVMRAMTAGRDLGTLSKDLEKRYGITRRRAAFIARDQANKQTAVINRARQQELGITQARWRHSGGGKHPRPSHLEAGQADGGKGKLYDVEKGCLIDGKYVLPGQLPNCRCTARSVIPGFDS
nr:phage minor head protein [Burkholderia multivorans]